MIGKDDVKVIQADWSDEQYSRNDLKLELERRKADGSIDGSWTLHDYIVDITGKNGQCHWIKDHERLFGKTEDD